MIRIITVGKKHDSLFEQAIAHYQKRLMHYSRIEWLLLPHSDIVKESQQIGDKIRGNDYVILFDERGKPYTSNELAGHIDKAQQQSKDVTCVIGGAYGVAEELAARADAVVSFGRAVFPHQLVRLMVTEQLYRSYAILNDSGYHH